MKQRIFPKSHQCIWVDKTDTSDDYINSYTERGWELVTEFFDVVPNYSLLSRCRSFQDKEEQLLIAQLKPEKLKLLDGLKLKTYKNHESENIFVSAEALLLSDNPLNFFSAGFLYHKSFKLLLQGFLLKEQILFQSNHSLQELALMLPKNVMLDLQKNISEVTIYGKHLVRYAPSKLKDRLHNINSDKDIFEVVISQLDKLQKTGTTDWYDHNFFQYIHLAMCAPLSSNDGN